MHNQLAKVVETHCICEESMGARPTQEVPANLVIKPLQVGVHRSHRLWTHHLLSGGVSMYSSVL